MTGGMRLEPPRRGGSLVLALLAMAATQLFRAEHQWYGWLVVVEAAVTLLCVAVLIWITDRSRDVPSRQTMAAGPRGWLLGAMPLILLPMLTQLLARTFRAGDPNETVLMMCVQNAALATAVASPWWRYRQIALLLSSFLTLFVLFSTMQPPVLAVGMLFAIVGLWSLMGQYWERLAHRMAADTRRYVPVRGGVFLITALLLLAISLLTLSWSSGFATRVLAGFLPTSGGDRWGGEYGRGGVGEGDQLVSAQDHASTFGPVETDLFLSSEQPSLYDTFNDMYGEPVRQKFNRAIALDSSLGRESHARMAESRQAVREFPAVRQRPGREHRAVEDRDSDALLFVVGPTPVHLRLETFDHFDGTRWSHSEQVDMRRTFRLKLVDGKPWMKLDVFDPQEMFMGKRTHAVKIINLETARIPAPAPLAAWHVDHVDQPGFFGWTADDVPELTAQERLPPLTVVHLVSRLWDVRAIDRMPLLPANADHGPYGQLPSRSYRTLAESWAGDLPRGLPQVERIVTAVRESGPLDPSAVAPEHCQDVVAHFLEAGRGPDYLFATTTVVLLRSLGYRARLVSGFYADNRDFDPRSRQSIVNKQNVHVWVEVQPAGDAWIPVEPTPGYAQPLRLLTWRQRLAQTLAAAVDWSHERWWLLGLSAMAAVLLMRRTRGLCDGVAYAAWRVAFRGHPRRQVLLTLRLLEWRAWLAGWRRPRTCTVTHWYASWPAGAGAECADLSQLARYCDWALYGSEMALPSSAVRELRQVCHRVVTSWTATRLARHRVLIRRQARALAASRAAGDLPMRVSPSSPSCSAEPKAHTAP